MLFKQKGRYVLPFKRHSRPAFKPLGKPSQFEDLAAAGSAEECLRVATSWFTAHIVAQHAKACVLLLFITPKKVPALAVFRARVCAAVVSFIANARHNGGHATVRLLRHAHHVNHR